MKRKRLSIKTRVTLWYTTLLAMLVGLVVAAVLVMSDSMEEMQAKKLLETAVNHAADLLVYDGEDVTFSEPVETYENGIYLLFYDENYRFLDGSWPQKFPNGVDAANRAFQAIRRGNTTYYVYDHLLEFASGGVWIRGIYEATGAQFILDNVVRVILIALPALAALAALGGWLITRNAFRVVDELRQQADSISGGQDLSRRIPVNGERDELHRLAGTLNRMFDRLEDSFQADLSSVQLYESQADAHGGHPGRVPVRPGIWTNGRTDRRSGGHPAAGEADVSDDRGDADLEPDGAGPDPAGTGGDRPDRAGGGHLRGSAGAAARASDPPMGAGTGDGGGASGHDDPPGH